MHWMNRGASPRRASSFCPESSACIAAPPKARSPDSGWIKPEREGRAFQLRARFRSTHTL